VEWDSDTVVILHSLCHLHELLLGATNRDFPDHFKMLIVVHEVILEVVIVDLGILSAQYTNQFVSEIYRLFRLMSVLLF
jgi:hypothetical protein